MAGTNVATNDWYQLRISVSSSCPWQETPAATLAAGDVPATAPPAPNPETGPDYSGGGGSWHTLGVASTNFPAGTVVNGSYDAWVGSNCFGQVKTFSWEAFDALGFVASTGSATSPVDSSSGHDVHITGTFTMTPLTGQDWYGLRVSVSSGCTFQSASASIGVLQAPPPTPTPTPVPTPTPIPGSDATIWVSWNGQSQTGLAPPDPTGAIGPSS